jgi:hypothetical protein
MTHDEQIKQALHLLDPPPKERTKWRWEVEHALEQMQEMHIAADMCASKRSKAVTKTTAKLHAALTKVRDESRKLCATGWKPPIDLAVIERAVRDTAPRRHKKPVKLEEMNVWAAYGATATAPMDAHKAAVRLAHNLLKQRSLPINITGPGRSSPQGGTWHQLAQILFGARINLFQHLRKYFRDQNSPGRI